jgi:hypothetical protein
MLTRLTYEERERLAHAEGFVNTAELFAKIADLEHAAQALIDILEKDAPELSDKILAAMDAMREQIE